MPAPDLAYEDLPRQVRDNLTYEQWQQAQPAVISNGEPVPETTQYINLKNAFIRVYQQGARGGTVAAHA
jgi:hypothetical protein